MDDIDRYIEDLFNDDVIDQEEFETKAEYQELLGRYLARRNRDIEDNNDDILSVYFQISNDFDTKNKVLNDALEKGIDIEESNYYPDLLEGPVVEEPSRRI